MKIFTFSSGPEKKWKKLNIVYACVCAFHVDTYNKCIVKNEQENPFHNVNRNT